MSHVTAVRRLGTVAALPALLAALPVPAHAASLVEGIYDVTVGGFQVGVGGLRARITENGYSATVNVRMSGLARLVGDGKGSATSVGAMAGTKPLPARYSLNTSSGQYSQSIRMAMIGGSVRLLTIDPEPLPRPGIVPVTGEHRRGILDPVSALVMPLPGSGQMLAPEACTRTLPVFDGRARYDIRLTYDRMEEVSPQPDASARSYSGPVIVCRASYRALAGHKAGGPQTKQMESAPGTEVWLAPVQGSRVLVPWKISVKTPSGQAVIEARELKMRGLVEQQRAQAKPEPRSERPDARSEKIEPQQRTELAPVEPTSQP